MLPMAELHRGSFMEFSSGTMAGIRKRWKEELGEEVKGQEEEDNAQIPVRMTMTMDEMEIHCEALSQCDSVNKLDDSSTHGAHRAQWCAVITSV